MHQNADLLFFRIGVGGGTREEVQQTYNVLYASYMEAIRIARETAKQQNLPVEQVIVEARAKLAESLDAIVSKKPTLGEIPKHNPNLKRDPKGRPIFESD